MPFLYIVDPFDSPMIPGPRRYKIAGTVLDLSDEPLSRSVSVVVKTQGLAAPLTTRSSAIDGKFSVRVDGGPGQKFVLIVHGDKALEEHSRVFDHLTAALAY